MEPVKALRLAQIHNNTDKVHHELNTKEKVISFFFQNNFYILVTDQFQ